MLCHFSPHYSSTRIKGYYYHYFIKERMEKFINLRLKNQYVVGGVQKEVCELLEARHLATASCIIPVLTPGVHLHADR